MDVLSIFKDLAIIMLFAKVFGLVARKLKAPQVVGEIVAGLLIGPSVLGFVQQNDFINVCAQIGVVILMFSAGLGTNLRDLLRTGPKALAIACAGVAVPLVGGTLLYQCFYGFSPWGSEKFLTAVFIGVIMTATSVSITGASASTRSRSSLLRLSWALLSTRRFSLSTSAIRVPTAFRFSHWFSVSDFHTSPSTFSVSLTSRAHTSRVLSCAACAIRTISRKSSTSTHT